MKSILTGIEKFFFSLFTALTSRTLLAMISFLICHAFLYRGTHAIKILSRFKSNQSASVIVLWSESLSETCSQLDTTIRWHKSSGRKPISADSYAAHL